VAYIKNILYVVEETEKKHTNSGQRFQSLERDSKADVQNTKQMCFSLCTSSYIPWWGKATLNLSLRLTMHHTVQTQHVGAAPLILNSHTTVIHAPVALPRGNIRQQAGNGCRISLVTYRRQPVNQTPRYPGYTSGWSSNVRSELD